MPQYVLGVRCSLFLMTGLKKNEGRAGSFPHWPLAHRLSHSDTHTHYCSWVWDFHREVFNLHWGLASHTAQPKPPTYRHAPFLRLTPTFSLPFRTVKATWTPNHTIYLSSKYFQYSVRTKIYNYIPQFLLCFSFPQGFRFAGPALPSFSMQEP